MKKRLVLCVLCGSMAMFAARLTVLPSNPLLFGQGARQQLLVVIERSDGAEEDVTAKARFSSEKPAVATVDSTGTIEARANGGARLRVEYAGLNASTTALVERAD